MVRHLQFEQVVALALAGGKNVLIHPLLQDDRHERSTAPLSATTVAQPQPELKHLPKLHDKAKFATQAGKTSVFGSNQTGGRQDGDNTFSSHYLSVSEPIAPRDDKPSASVLENISHALHQLRNEDKTVPKQLDSATALPAIGAALTLAQVQPQTRRAEIPKRAAQVTAEQTQK